MRENLREKKIKKEPVFHNSHQSPFGKGRGKGRSRQPRNHFIPHWVYPFTILSELVNFENGVLFYGMWKGYMEQPELHEFLDFMHSKGVKVHALHTSGHADANTIEKIIEKTRPNMIIPVHTENAEWFRKYKPTIQILDEPSIEL